MRPTCHRVTAELAIVVPTYREHGNITRLYRALSRVLAGHSWEVLFVDDDSDDGSQEELAALARDDARVRWLRRVGRRGLSSACIEGVRATKTPFVCIMDADLQHDESLIPSLLNALKAEGADLAVGSRYVAAGSTGSLPPARVFVSRAATLLCRALSGVRLSDPMSGFFMMKRSLFDEVQPRLSGRGFKLLLDVLLSCRGRVACRELPYSMRSRERGKSKLSAAVVRDLLILLLCNLPGRVIPARFLSFGRRRVHADGLAVFGAAVGVYLYSAPRGVMLDDDGYFILAAWFNGVAHAPGYPLYTTLAHLATWLPFGSVAFRVHAASALFGALACVCLWAVARQLAAGRAHAVTAALCFAFSATFWSQATVAEVYSLNALFFFGLMAFALQLGRSAAPAPAQIRAFAFLYGLSLSNHWPLMILSAPALLAALWPLRREVLRRLPSATLCGMLGLAPYLWMVVRSWNAEISFHGPIETPRELWFYLSREEYRQIDAAPGAGWDDRLRFSLFAITEAARQFVPPGAAVAALGFWRQWRVWPRHVAWALVLGFLGSTFLLIALLGFEYDLRYKNVFRAYPLVAWGILALWLALGTKWAVERLQAIAARRARPAFLQWGAVLVLAGGTFAWNAPQNWRASDTWARDYALTLLDAMPPRARFFVLGDYTTGPVAYLNLIENHRRDVSLYSVKGLLFATRLFDAQGVDPRSRFEAIDELIRSGTDPVLYTTVLPHGYGAVDHGLFYRVAPEMPPAASAVVLEPGIRSFLETALDRGPPADLSQLLQYNEFTVHYCRLVATLVEHASGDNRPLADSLESRCSGYQGLLQRAETALRGEPPDPERALLLLARAAELSDEAVTSDNRAALDYLRGMASLMTGDAERAASHFASAVSIWPAPENPAYEFLSGADGVARGRQ